MIQCTKKILFPSSKYLKNSKEIHKIVILRYLLYTVVLGIHGILFNVQTHEILLHDAHKNHN